MFHTLRNAERPQTTIYWLRRPPGHGPTLLGRMARGEIEISHDTFRDLPANKAHNYLRDLLTAVGVLEPYEAQLERITPWLTQLLASLPRDHAELINRYANWHVLRYLRRNAERKQVSRAQVLAWRARINAAVRFLDWSRRHDIHLPTMTQAELEHYLVSYPGAAATLRSFLNWARHTGLNPRIRVAPAGPAMPHVTTSDHERWRHIDQLLHDGTIRLYARLGGLFLLLFARPLTATCLMRTEQITRTDDGPAFITFDQTPVEMPEPLDQLLAQHVGERGRASYLSRENGWLFPGGIPGNPLATENIRAELVAHGIHPGRSRTAAMFALAAELPAPVLADLIGVAPKTAVKWPPSPPATGASTPQTEPPDSLHHQRRTAIVMQQARRPRRRSGQNATEKALLMS